MKIEAIDDKFFQVTEVNNSRPEIIEYDLSNGKKSYALVINDFLKYPDEFTSLLQSFPHFENESGWSGRPGKSFVFAETYRDKYTFFIRKKLFEVFKIDFYPLDLYTNCFSGVMNTHFVPPHVDYDIESKRTHLACNLSLTKNISNCTNGTSFWTFCGKEGVLEMNKKEQNDYFNYMNDQTVTITEWDNYDKDSYWNLEYIVPMKYNSLVAYSPTLFHIPYFDKKCFIDTDRFSLASMYDIRFDRVSEIPERYKLEAFDIWNKFELCKIFNYHF